MNKYKNKIDRYLIRVGYICMLTRLSTRRVADNANCSNGREMCETLENKRHHTSKSHHEAENEVPGWEDPKESRARIR